MAILPSDLLAPFIPTHRDIDDATIDWNWKETPQAHIFKFDLPGFSKSDVRINIYPDTRVLHIMTVEKIEDDVVKGETWHCKERGGTRKFSKQFRLPANAKVNGITASMKDGVLVVTVEKEGVEWGGHQGEKVKRRSVVIEGKDDEKHRQSGKGGVLGSCFVCFKP